MMIPLAWDAGAARARTGRETMPTTSASNERMESPPGARGRSQSVVRAEVVKRERMGGEGGTRGIRCRGWVTRGRRRRRRRSGAEAERRTSAPLRGAVRREGCGRLRDGIGVRRPRGRPMGRAEAMRDERGAP